MRVATIFLGAALLSVPGVAWSVPAMVSASYGVSRDGLDIGMVDEHFERDRHHYRLVSEINPAGLAALFRGTEKFTSTGAVTRAGLRPERFVTERSDDASKKVSAVFDWGGRRLHMTFDGHDQTMALAQGTQDRASVMYQFLFLHLKDVRRLEFPMTNGKKIEHYRYRLAGDEVLLTPLGKLSTLHLVKEREENDGNSVEVWLARDRHLFPIRLMITEKDGTRFMQNITRLEFK